MYFDPRLWQFTEGLRLRIAGAVVLGLLSAAVGIARLALLGWLLGRVFQGESFGDLILPIIAGGLDVGALILGGAVIGTLGALDDVTVTQAALVSELHYRNPRLRVGELVSSGIRVGREHIASTVNTLLLAYAGASIPLVMLFAVSNQSLVMVANSELIAVEIVRTLCGSMGLVAAVPITTTLAALVAAGSPAEHQAPS